MRTKTVYVAGDGQEFDNKEKCVEYEKTEFLRFHLRDAGLNDGLIARIMIVLLRYCVIAPKPKSKTLAYLNKSGETSD